MRQQEEEKLRKQKEQIDNIKINAKGSNLTEAEKIEKKIVKVFKD